MFSHRAAVLCSLLAVGALLMGARPTSGAAPEQRYVVKPGDTLWEITDARYEGDPREAIWRVGERNRLQSSSLSPGQVLYLPP